MAEAAAPPWAAAAHDPAARARIERWLIEEAPASADVGALVEGLALALRAEGVPVVRATSHIRTLHPVYLGVTRLWRQGQGVTESRPEHGVMGTSVYLGSTVQHVFETGQWFERRLGPATDAERTPLAELRAQGLTHYALAPLPFTTGVMNAMSWSTDAPGGFEDGALALLHGLLPSLRLVTEIKAAGRVMAEVLAAYVGREPAERILAGTIRRGEVTVIRAAILLADLRGSSALAERLRREEVIDALDRYLDAVVPAVLDHGGEVLKFMGDGVLAIFRVPDGAGPEAAARASLAAAQAALAALEGVEVGTGAAAVPLRMGVALHLGEVAYGNIGARNRLDFTVIGSDVNLASRIEGLCGSLGEPLLLSERIAPLTGAPLDPLGTHAVKGFAVPVRLFRPRPRAAA